MADDLDWAWQEMALKGRLAEIDGDAFESLFGDIAKAAWGSDYSATIPMGRRGDLKCDGFRHSLGVVHQLYGPRYGQANVDQALAKIEEDFRGAKVHWGPLLKKWIFVVGLYQGRVPSELLRAVAILSAELNVPAEVWTRAEIVVLASGLPASERRALFGVAPDRADMVRHVTYANIGRALAFIRGHDAAAPLDPVPLPPKVALKADYNGLSMAAKRFLGLGQTGADHVRRYLMDRVDPSEAQRMADGFGDRYKAVIAKGAEPDAAFGEMLGFAGGGTTDVTREAAALVVVAHFFSTCEIFDRPPADWQLVT
jgi:hypothetical protein